MIYNALELEHSVFGVENIAPRGYPPDNSQCWLYFMGRRKTRCSYILGGIVIDRLELGCIGRWLDAYRRGDRDSLELDDSSHVLVTREGVLDWFVGVPLSKKSVRHICSVVILPEELDKLHDYFATARA